VGWILGGLVLGARILVRLVPQIWRHIVDYLNGVQARYVDLRLTETALWTGWGKTAVHFSLTELVARLEEETGGNSGWLIVDGPGILLRRRVGYRPDGQADIQAQKFVQAVNFCASPYSDRAASAWVDAHGIRWSPPEVRMRPRWRTRRRTRRWLR
jgi:hypothetical protein